MRGFLTKVQPVLLILGVLGIVLGIIVFVAGNSSLGSRLIIGGIALLVLRQSIEFAYFSIVKKKIK